MAGLRQEFGSLFALHLIKTLYQRLELLEHLVVTLGHRTADDKRRAGIVDQHRVYLIDDGIVVLTLYKVGRRHGHIVTQVIEAELVVRTEGDVCLIGLAACGRVRLVLVDTVDGQSVEHIERPHPLGVTLCQIVVDGYDVDTVAGERIEKHRKGGNECLALTCRHLGDLALMQDDTAEDLYVIVYHLPLQVVAAGCPVVMVNGLVAIDRDEVLGRVSCQFTVEVGCRDNRFLVLRETACRILHNGEGDRHHLVERRFVVVESLLVQLVNLVEDFLALVNRCLLDLCTQLCYLLTLLPGCILYILLYLFCLGTQLIIAERLDFRISRLHLVYVRLNQLHVTC